MNLPNETPQEGLEDEDLSIHALRAMIKAKNAVALSAAFDSELPSLNEDEKEWLLSCLLMKRGDRGSDTPGEVFLTNLIAKYRHGALKRENIDVALEEFDINYGCLELASRRTFREYPHFFRGLISKSDSASA